MSLFKKFIGKSKGDKAKANEVEGKKPKSEAEETGTTLRKSDKATPLTSEKERAELNALEMADRKEWAVKTLSVWQPGDVILDTYEVEDVFSGGMGHVYIAMHKNWKVKLAIKSPNATMLSERDLFARILREANSWTELGLHPNIAYCYYVRNIEDVPHIFVEYVGGGDLKTWIEEGKCLDYKDNLDLAIQFCHGMGHAHSKGMIHRDVKPANVLMTKEGILKITDFGLVRTEYFKEESINSNQIAPEIKDEKLTSLGEMGTPGYYSPEQFANPHEVDERTDIFAFGVCLYEMFCGNRPYEITFGPKQEAPDPIGLSCDAKFPPALANILKRSVQWDASDRYGSFKEIRKVLTRLYKELYNEKSPYAELELIDLEADGLNNMGVSYFDLETKEDAVSSWEKALKINSTHLEATYNLSLIKWREAKISDYEVLIRLANCENNPAVDKETLAELTACIHAERFAPDAAREVLKDYPGRYEALFSDMDIGKLRWIHTLTGHTSKVESVAISPDGRTVVSASLDETLRVWELETGQCVRTLTGHTGYVNSVAISQDGRTAVSASWDKTLRVWELKTGQCVRTLTGHTSSIKSVAISPDGRTVVSASNDETLRVWDLETGQCVRTLTGHTNIVGSVALSPDGRTAVSASWDKTLRVWDLETGQCVRTLAGHTNIVGSVALSPDGRTAVSGSDKTLRVWDLETGQCVRTLTGHTGYVNSVAISPDGRTAVSASEDETLRVWALKTGQCVRTLSGHTGFVLSVALSPDGRTAVSASEDETLRVWDINFEKRYIAELAVSVLKGFRERKAEKDALLQAVQQSADLYKRGNYKESFSILHSAWNDTGYMDESTVKRQYTRLMEMGRVKSLVFSYQKRLLKGHTDGVISVALNPDGRTAVSASEDKTLRVWDLETGQCVRTLTGHTKWVMSVALSADGRTAVSASADKTLRVWDLETGQCVRTLTGHTSRIESVAISPDGRAAVSASFDKTLRVWDLETGQCVRTLTGHTGSVNSVAISPDGRTAVSGSEGDAVSASFDETLRVWDLETGQCVRTLTGHTSSIESVAISPDGRTAVSASDKTLRVWDLETGPWLRTLTGHTDEVRSVAISPDGRTAVSASVDETLRVWDLETGQCVRTLTGHTGIVLSVALSPDGRTAVVASSDNTLRVWELIWDLEFSNPVDWDEGVRAYLEIFLTLRNGKWTEEDFQGLITELSEKRGYGWVRPEGIRKELDKMTKDFRS